VHITALCPFCRTGYQVQAMLRGQMVRCPNAACRKIFPVPMDVPPSPASAAPPRPSAPPDNGQRSGSVADMVPMLPSETATPARETPESSKHVSEMLPLAPSQPAAESRPAEGDWWQAAPPVRDTSSKPVAPPPKSTPSPPPADTTWWRDAPPPVRQAASPAAKETTPRLLPVARPPAETQPMPAVPPQADAPRELPPGVWEPPPVRRGTDAKENITETPASTVPPPRLGKRRAWVVIASLFFLTFGILGSVGAWVWIKFHASEEARLADARADYEKGAYGSAAEKYRILGQKFPDSGHAADYRFLADWSAVCSAASDPDADPVAAAAKVEQFVKEHKKDPLMVERGRDAGQLTLKLTKAFAARNANPADEQPLKAAERIEELRRMVASLGPEALSKEESGLIDVDLGSVRRAVEKARKRRAVLAQLRPRDKETPMEAIERVRSLLARSERELPDITKDDEARAAVAKLYDDHLASVVYRRRNVEEVAPAPPPRPIDDGESIGFTPLWDTAAPGNAPPDDPVVLALARGVLYALKKSNGERKWMTRVGPDTTVLPLRVPPTQTREELMLVLSADTQTLSALNAKGHSVWEYFIGQPVLGRPIVIEPRAYLAAYDGTIHEIELAGGQLLGRWSLGQRLTCGGAREGDSHRIYFPADDSCIYVLDVNPEAPRCVTILYDGHPSGSLRSEPVVIPPEGDTAPGYLILNQASGLDATSLRVFKLPLQDGHDPELTLKPPARFSGWTWFAPKQDGERLAIVSDAGTLGLFGIRQQGNDDQALFPALQPGGLDLSPFLRERMDNGEWKVESRDNAPLSTSPSPLSPLRAERGRSQVVSMQGDDLWVLAHGRLQQMELRLQEAHGPQALPRWPKPLMLGSPLHASRRVEDRDSGRSTFFLVTQALDKQTCLATAVEEGGKILWQRQLGLVCQADPLTLTPPDGGASMVLALDRGGGLFVLDPAQPANNQRPQLLAPALKENPLMPPYLLPSADGHSAYEVAAPGDGRRLIVRHVDWLDGERRLRVRLREASLQSRADNSILTLAGPPVVADGQLLLPMNDGKLRRLSLDSDDSTLPSSGPSWRNRLAPRSAVCNVLALGGNRVLATDGGRNLAVWKWQENWELLTPEGEAQKTLEYLIATPPVLLPPQANAPPRVVAGDSANVLHLFAVTAEGQLKPGLPWNLPGKITTGPFVHKTPKGETRFGCIVDRRHLLWFDPDKKEPLWTYSSESGAILGQPRWIENVLALALHSGRYLALDPNDGRPKGAGYTLRASAAPAASPTAFGPGLFFAPLSDGTALLLSVDKLRGKP
jgi:outer membrane protein assembly factor BamB